MTTGDAVAMATTEGGDTEGQVHVETQVNDPGTRSYIVSQLYCIHLYRMVMSSDLLIKSSSSRYTTLTNSFIPHAMTVYVACIHTDTLNSLR